MNQKPFPQEDPPDAETTTLRERAQHWLQSNPDVPYDAALETVLDVQHHNEAYELIQEFLAAQPSPVPQQEWQPIDGAVPVQGQPGVYVSGDELAANISDAIAAHCAKFGDIGYHDEPLDVCVRQLVADYDSLQLENVALRDNNRAIKAMFDERARMLAEVAAKPSPVPSQALIAGQCRHERLAFMNTTGGAVCIECHAVFAADSREGKRAEAEFATYLAARQRSEPSPVVPSQEHEDEK